PHFVFETAYDAHGRVASFTYPTGLGYRNVYENGYLTQVQKKDDNALYWKAISRDAEGRVTREELGNGVTTDRTYKPASGFIDTILAGTLNGSVLTASVQNDVYGFDFLGNLTSRYQYATGSSTDEQYTYDALNRLTAVFNNGVSPKTVKYDEIGNIVARSDVGAYSYTGCGGAHRVCNITGPFTSGSYGYDANGNMVSAGNGRTLTWASFNLPASITAAGVTEAFLYSPEYERVRRVATDGSSTVYINPRIDLGGTFEKNRKADGSSEFVHHLYAGSQVVGSVTTASALVLNATLWQTRLETAPTTANNPTGIKLLPTTSDPHALITWSATPSPNDPVP
ncbi:MAG: hypothetical protein Q8J78_00740, partial [Moraxellaceae bacterium]|nr:hypothetical protein [Moraxellaceae bacterium]